MANYTINPGGETAEIVTTPNKLVSVVTDQPVVVLVQNAASATPNDWVPFINFGLNDADTFIAPSSKVKLANRGAAIAKAEVNPAS